MAIKRLGSPNNSAKGSQDDDDDLKPLIRDYGKDNPDIYTEAHPVIRGKISKSGQWCIIETESYVLLLKASCSAVVELYENILPNLNGKRANQLVIEPVKKNKFGGCLGVDDESQIWYEYNVDDKSFELLEQAPVKEKKQQELTLDMFLDVKSSAELSSSQVSKDHETTSQEKATRTRKTIKRETDD